MLTVSGGFMSIDLEIEELAGVLRHHHLIPD